MENNKTLIFNSSNNIIDTKDDFWLSILFKAGSGFVIGFGVGYFLKKSLKISLFLLGGVAIVLFILDFNGIIKLNLESFTHQVDSFILSFKNLFLFLKDKMKDVEIAGGGGALVGFFLGLKVG